jgi:glycosyltransferase involved in cell wall biosynthesis
VLITKDAEDHLDQTLESLAVCSEIVILDSGSTDGTREIAAQHGARWHEHPFDGYGPQKCRAVKLASHDWILSIDADEVLDHGAVTAIAAVDWATADLLACWRIRRRTFVGDREIRHGHWSSERPVRIFNRLVTGVRPILVHESVRATTQTRHLPGAILHHSYADLSDVIRLDFHRLKAIRYRQAGRSAGGGLLALRAVWAGFHSYIVRGGCLEGGAGVVIALAAAVNATMGLAMASEREDAGSQAVPGRPQPVPREAGRRVVYPKTA